MTSSVMQPMPADRTAPVVRKATREEVREVADTIALAFFDDPVCIWVYPDPERRVTGFRDTREIMLSDDWMRHDLVTCTEGIEAAAIWVPPDGPELDEAQARQLESRLAQVADVQTLERFGVLDGLMREHHPTDPHYYLPLLGTRPERQGRGLGSALLAHMTRRCDAEGMPAYLEASSERNRALYERHGFEALRPLPIPDGPTMQAMWRTPRR